MTEDDETLDTLLDTGSGGSVEKLNDKRVAGKLQKLWAAHEKPGDAEATREAMKRRNAMIRAKKGLPPRE